MMTPENIKRRQPFRLAFFFYVTGLSLLITLGCSTSDDEYADLYGTWILTDEIFECANINSNKIIEYGCDINSCKYFTFNKDKSFAMSGQSSSQTFNQTGVWSIPKDRIKICLESNQNQPIVDGTNPDNQNDYDECSFLTFEISEDKQILTLIEEPADNTGCKITSLHEKL